MKYLLLLVLSGCAPTMSELVHQEIEVGDSTKRLVRILGEPQSIDQTGACLTYKYFSKRDEQECQFSTQDNIIATIVCASSWGFNMPPSCQR